MRLLFSPTDVSHLNIDPNNTIIIRQLKKGVKDAMKFSNPLKENLVYGFYFGMPYDSVKNYTFSDALQKNDSSRNPILLPYDLKNKYLRPSKKLRKKSRATANLADWNIVKFYSN